MKVPFFRNSTNTVPSIQPLGKILDGIKVGRWKKQIDIIRQTEDEDGQNTLKKELPNFIVSGMFDKGKTSKHFISYLSHFVLDFDKLKEEELKYLKQEVIAEPFVLAAFVSPRNNGLKAIIKTDNDDFQLHKEYFDALTLHYKQNFDVEVDQSGSNINRICYISHDPDIFINQEKVECFTVDSLKLSNADKNWEPVKTKFEGKMVSTNVYNNFKVAINWTNKHYSYVKGQRNDYIYRMAYCLNKLGVTYGDAMFMMQEYFIELNPTDNSFLRNRNSWEPTIRSAYFHHRDKHNTVDAYELDKSAVPKDDFLDVVRKQLTAMSESGIGKDDIFNFGKHYIKQTGIAIKEDELAQFIVDFK